jgi:hypothetical protein
MTVPGTISLFSAASDLRRKPEEINTTEMRVKPVTIPMLVFLINPF